jgi:hypothetical protein
VNAGESHDATATLSIRPAQIAGSPFGSSMIQQNSAVRLDAQRFPSDSLCTNFRFDSRLFTTTYLASRPCASAEPKEWTR